MFSLFLCLGVSALFYHRASLPVWTVALGAVLLLYTGFVETTSWTLSFFWLVYLLSAVFLNVSALRQQFVSRRVMHFFRRVMPSMSRTEKEALAAGTITWEADLFRGDPDWNTLLSFPAPALSSEEQAFLEGPVRELCALLNDWEITHQYADLPPKVWEFIKAQGFFGMIIPKRYGGKEFSAYAHSMVLQMVNSVSVSAGAVVSVPNSLGPAELLLHYGTDAQKEYYLPRLARGEEIPCFALTSPVAGSDAAAIPDTGIVTRGMFEGKETLGIRLNWDKRYITLAPHATVLGLAFKLYDPEHLIGKIEDYGITCALIPTKTLGVVIGRRHFPLNNPFPNGPTQGKDVFIPMDYLIGGAAMAGQGWRMLMECLAAGRAISLPASAAGSSKMASLTTGAYAAVRRQFGVSIGQFEGIQEALARIGGHTYMIDALCRFAAAAIDRGQHPAVASAITKYHTTQLARLVSSDAMDVHGGKGVCLGPKNYLARAYQGAPISITVEGANILTRCLMIFGQGAVRCHPYLLAEIDAVEKQDETAFDKAFFGHVGYTLSNVVRSLVLNIGWYRFAKAPLGPIQKYFRQMKRFSAAYALLADLAMLSIGGDLKRKERLSARLGDILSLLYMASAVLKKHADQGAPVEDLPLVRWACKTIAYHIQEGMAEILRNFPIRAVAVILWPFIFPFGRHCDLPSDKLDHWVSDLLLKPGAARDRLTEGAYRSSDKAQAIGVLEEAFVASLATEELERRFQRLVKTAAIVAHARAEQLAEALEKRLLTEEEVAMLREMDTLRLAAIAVDDFDYQELARFFETSVSSKKGHKKTEFV